MSKMKNSNIRQYAETMVRENKSNSLSYTVMKWLKVAYFVAALGTVLTCLTQMMGAYVMMSEYSAKENADQIALYGEMETLLITMIIAVATVVATFFLLKYKLCIPFALLGSVDCVLIFTTLYSVSVNRANDFDNSGVMKFWIMAVPAILLAVVSITLGFLIFKTYRLAIPKMYDKIIYELYRSHTKNGEVALSTEEFEKICDEYKGEEIFRTDIPLKKSVRKRKQKQDEVRMQAMVEDTQKEVTEE